MPLHLPPLSRRKFIARAVAAGTGIALAPRLSAAAKPVDENSWALLADTHIAADPKAASRGVTMAEHFAAVSRELTDLPKVPAGVFVVGDCAYNSGESGDYETLARFLEPVRAEQMPVHLALGNHDHRDRFRAVLDKAESRPLADRRVALLRTPRANWFVLDSLEKTLSVPGLLGQEQLDWLAASLDKNTDKPALVLIHHQPDQRQNIAGLKDTEALFGVIRPRKQVKAYLFGHTHHWSVTRDESGIHLVNLPPVAYVFQQGDPSGWVHAALKPDGMRLELRCIDRKHPAHGQVTELSWRA